MNVTLTHPLPSFHEQRWPTGPELLVALDVLLVIADAILLRMYA